MHLTEIRDIVAAGAKDVKERACRKRPTDISNTIDAYRGGDPVATVILKGSSVKVLEVYLQAATGYEADQLAVMIESFTTGPALDPPFINPVTGEEIGSRSLSDLFYNHDGAAKGWVRECLFIQVYNRAGDMIAARLPYHYVGGRHLVWDERQNLPDDYLKPGETMDSHGMVASGAMADPMWKWMNDLPSFSQAFPGIVTEETTRAELDLLVTEAIQSRIPCTILLWAMQGGKREEAIRNAMRRSQ